MAPEDRDIAEAIAAQAGLDDRAPRAARRPGPTVLGHEEGGQAVVREALDEIGLEPVDVPMDAEALRAHPVHSPFDWDVDGMVQRGRDLAPGRDRPRPARLILNGHVDVVSPGAAGAVGTRPVHRRTSRTTGSTGAAPPT